MVIFVTVFLVPNGPTRLWKGMMGLPMKLPCSFWSGFLIVILPGIARIVRHAAPL